MFAVHPAQISNPSGVGGAIGGAAPASARPAGGHGGPRGGLPPGAPTATQDAALTYNAPTPYAWLPSSSVWLYAGLGLAALVVLGIGVWLLLRKRPLVAGEIVLVPATAALLIPLLLPNMHERYFYLAEVLLVVACLVDLRFLIPALGIQVASISTYLGYLRNQPLMPVGRRGSRRVDGSRRRGRPAHPDPAAAFPNRRAPGDRTQRAHRLTPRRLLR